MKIPRLALCTHRFRLSGLNLERFINLMSREEIPLLRVRRRGSRALVCECFSADLPRIRAIADKKGWRLEQVVPAGVSGWMAWLRGRPGIPIGLALACAAVLTLSQFVWRVDIQGAGAYRAEIAAYLSQSGYRAGTRRSAVDAQALEAALTYRYPNISWFHVHVRGMSLVVEVTPGAAMPQLSSGQPGDIVASRMGIVDSVRVYAGTVQVKPGDVVQKGQVLIRGEERGADGSTVPVAAEGVITARCWHTESVSLPLYEVISEETGRETVQVRIRTPFGNFARTREGPPYLAYNTYVSETPVVGSFFPVAHQRVIHREAAMEYVKRDVDAVRLEAEEAAMHLLKTALFGYELIDKWVDYCMIEDDTLALSACAEWLMDIGEPRSP